MEDGSAFERVFQNVMSKWGLGHNIYTRGYYQWVVEVAFLCCHPNILSQISFFSWTSAV
jgi:hypothetical protein